jgi:hypothetical protein
MLWTAVILAARILLAGRISGRRERLEGRPTLVLYEPGVNVTVMG